MPGSSPTPSSRRCVAAVRSAVAATALAVIALVTAAVAPAGAQSATSVAPTTTVPTENPGSTAAGVVFFLVCGVVVIGALVLYLRNRRPRVPAPDA